MSNMMPAVVQSYLDKATKTLAFLGIKMPDEWAPVVSLVEKIAKYDEAKALTVAQTLQRSSAFNEMVRNEIGGMDIGSRFADIATSFNSIRDDASQMATWMSDGKLDFKEKIQYAWMKTTRGSIPDRFSSIKSSYLKTCEAARGQIERETKILNAYVDFRMALKTAEVLAQEILLSAENVLAERKKTVGDASEELEALLAGGTPAQVSAAELKRDETVLALQNETKSYQIAKDIADELRTAYSTAELVYARINQTHEVKERLYQRAVVFFSANEVVFTGLAAAFTSSAGLHEATQTMEAMKDGMNKGLEDLARTGSAHLEAGLRAGYGSSLQTSSVKMLADSILEYQESTFELIKTLRNEATAVSSEISETTESSKKKFAALLARV